MKIFILEDNIQRIDVLIANLSNHSLTITSNAPDAIDFLTKDSEYDFFLLDHDLGGEIFVDINEPNTGSTVAKFLGGKNIKGKVIVHSWNTVGAQNMMAHLPKSTHIPFTVSFVKELAKELNNV